MLAKDTLEEFKLECELRRLTPRTIKGYYNSTLLFLTWLERHQDIKELEAIRTQHIKMYIQYLIKKQLSPSYINAILRCIQPYLTVVHIGLHGVGVGGILIAGRLELLHSRIFVVPLILQSITSGQHLYGKFFTDLYFYRCRLLYNEQVSIIAGNDIITGIIHGYGYHTIFHSCFNIRFIAFYTISQIHSPFYVRRGRGAFLYQKVYLQELRRYPFISSPGFVLYAWYLAVFA